MKITREALILREIISLLESLKPAQRGRCLEEMNRRFRWNPPAPPIPTLTGTQEMGVATGILGGLPTIKEAPHDA